MKNTQEQIASSFQQMGIVVDQPKQIGKHSNDINTARKFSQKPKISSNLTGIN